MGTNDALDEFRVLKTKVGALELESVRLVERSNQLALALQKILEAEKVSNMMELENKYKALEAELSEKKAQWEQLIQAVTSEVHSSH